MNPAALHHEPPTETTNPPAEAAETTLTAAELARVADVVVTVETEGERPPEVTPELTTETAAESTELTTAKSAPQPPSEPPLDLLAIPIPLDLTALAGQSFEFYPAALSSSPSQPADHPAPRRGPAARAFALERNLSGAHH